MKTNFESGEFVLNPMELVALDMTSRRVAIEQADMLLDSVAAALHPVLTQSARDSFGTDSDIVATRLFHERTRTLLFMYERINRCSKLCMYEYFKSVN